jgi:hypothetical protein
MTVNRKQYH